MTHQLRAWTITVLADDLRLVPSTYLRWLTTTRNSTSRGANTLHGLCKWKTRLAYLISFKIILIRKTKMHYILYYNKDCVILKRINWKPCLNNLCATIIKLNYWEYVLGGRKSTIYSQLNVILFMLYQALCFVISK